MKRILFSVIAAILMLGAAPQPAPPAQADNPNPPAQPVKLIFIHHSTGENWLRDDNGGLGIALDRNNYFVSDTNYGWGPDSIGDRTDIPNWTKWFAGDDTPTIMQAVYNESGQNSEYTRSRSDPGGENSIILFKSCFPNSALEGNPNDPPSEEEGLTVGHAKWVYNRILSYFQSRPDKLFIVITAPPLSDNTYARNARAFNNWLVEDWLRENNYPLRNVAVYDFYNVLTGPDNHHRYGNGQVEHVINNPRNTTAYPSEDDHPNQQGNRKAAEEFVPVLNVFYNRWRAEAPAQPPAPAQGEGQPQQPQPGEGQQPPPLPGGQPAGDGLIDPFEGGTPPGTTGWETYRDETTPSSITCAPDGSLAHSGNASLKMEFFVPADSWVTCTLHHGEPRDWSGQQGLGFFIHAQPAGVIIHVDLYAGDPANQESNVYEMETPPESADGWAYIEIPWGNFQRVEWEENGGAPFTHTDAVLGLGFGASASPGTDNKGTVWIDDLGFIGSQAGGQPPAAPGEPRQPNAPQEEQERGGIRRFLPCGGSIALPMGLVFAGLLRRRKAARK